MDKIQKILEILRGQDKPAEPAKIEWPRPENVVLPEDAEGNTARKIHTADLDDETVKMLVDALAQAQKAGTSGAAQHALGEGRFVEEYPGTQPDTVYHGGKAESRDEHANHGQVQMSLGKVKPIEVTKTKISVLKNPGKLADSLTGKTREMPEMDLSKGSSDEGMVMPAMDLRKREDDEE